MLCFQNLSKCAYIRGVGRGLYSGCLIGYIFAGAYVWGEELILEGRIKGILRYTIAKASIRMKETRHVFLLSIRCLKALIDLLYH